MKTAEIIGKAPLLSVQGAITFDTVMKLRGQGEKILKESAVSELQFDLSQVNYADSSAVALLLTWLRSAQRFKKTLSYQHIPASMIRMSRLCGVTDLLPIQDSPTSPSN